MAESPCNEETHNRRNTIRRPGGQHIIWDKTHAAPRVNRGANLDGWQQVA